MANFKDLMRAFLYEEVDDDEEEEYDEDSAGFTVTTETVGAAPTQDAQSAALAQAAAQAQAMQAAQAASMQQLANVQIPQNTMTENVMVPNPSTQSTQSSQPTRNLDLTMDQIGQGESFREEPRPYRYDRRKLQTVRNRQEPTEYQAILSPIFGNIEDENKSFDSVHDAINLRKPDQETEITMIISPMYGNRKTVSPKQGEPVPEYKPKRKKAAAPSKEDKSGPRDLADYLTKEPIAIPRPAQKEDE